MACRALLQRVSSPRAISAPHVSALSAIHHFNITKCNNYNNTTNNNLIQTKPLNNSNIVSAKRHFSVSGRWNKELKTMSEEEVGGLKVQEQRLMRDLHETCEWGVGERWGSAPTETGMSRLALSDTDKQARDWFAETTKSLGCKVIIDAMGNQFAIREGLKEGPPTVAGSHLDTQPTGGRYDGILGVTAGIEMLRTLHDNDITTTFPV
ncbi:amidase, partial [Aureobasidium melanogenum]